MMEMVENFRSRLTQLKKRHLAALGLAWAVVIAIIVLEIVYRREISRFFKELAEFVRGAGVWYVICPSE